MTGAIYLSLYGLLTITSVFLVFVWSKLAWRRSRQMGSFSKMYRDRYMILAVGLTLNCTGTGILFGTRLLSVLVGGIETNLFTEAWAILICFGMATILTAKYGFMWAVEINRQDRWWRLLLALSIMWVLYAFWFQLWYVEDPRPYFQHLLKGVH